MMQARGELPHWVDVGLIPLINLAVALIVSGFVVLIIGENPFEAMWIMIEGALGSLKGWGYMLYYATNFVFTGLAVAVAFHAGLFNIGGEGQAYMAGVGAATVGLGMEWLPWPILLPLAILGLVERTRGRIVLDGQRSRRSSVSLKSARKTTCS